MCPVAAQRKNRLHGLLGAAGGKSGSSASALSSWQMMLPMGKVDCFLVEQTITERALCTRLRVGHQEDRGALVHASIVLSASHLLTTCCVPASGPGGGDRERSKIRWMCVRNSQCFGGKRRSK